MRPGHFAPAVFVSIRAGSIMSKETDLEEFANMFAVLANTAGELTRPARAAGLFERYAEADMMTDPGWVLLAIPKDGKRPTETIRELREVLGKIEKLLADGGEIAAKEAYRLAGLWKMVPGERGREAGEVAEFPK